MSKKNKQGKIKKLKDEDIPGINFELEDNAEDLFKEYLERIPQDASRAWDKDALESAQASTGALGEGKGGAQTGGEVSIDLHGLTLSDAIYQVDSKVRDLLARSGRIVQVKIITGKGLHSGVEGSVLAREVHAHVRVAFRKNIVRMDDSPADVTIDGLPLRGYFTVVFKKQGT